MGSRTSTVVSWIGAVVRARPNEPALVFDGETWTYRELWSRSADLARDLLAGGLQPGDRVAIVGENESAYVSTYMAILRAGGVAVPMNAMLGPAAIGAQMEFVGAKTIFVGRVKPEIREALDGSYDVRDLRTAPVSAQGRLPTIGPSSGCSIMLTSGSTGQPKGVVHTHESMLHGSMQVASAFPFGPGERGVVFLPLYACIPEQVLPTLCTGGSLEILPGFDVERVADACTRATTFDAVPTVLRRLIEFAPLEKLSKLKWVLFASEVMPTGLLRRWWAELPDLQMHQLYGMTEALPLTAAPHWLLKAEPTTVGRAFPTTGLQVRNGATPASDAGELVAVTPARMKEYFNDRETTTASLTGDGALRTGDLGRISDDGLVFLTGRLKDIIISGGMNIAPAEIEAVAAAHQGVQEVVVVGIPSDRWGETPVVVAVAKPGCGLRADELLQFCRGNLVSFKRPSGAALVSHLPIAGIGKVDKVAVKRMIENGELELVHA
ncbi:class I adenylate-forming enzyme family protein [Dactylosporangium sp. CA-233914]|uniref:class I adenylate-forming enzyme family protein n=1 Tax=Dactylosporangium sp. CA-233914 TaxID=3239934 RepID=UPI003D8ADF0A